MKEKTGTTLFIVASPFQCLCMLEAISYFQIIDYDVFVVRRGDYNLEKIHFLLNEYDIKYVEKDFSHIVKDYFPLIFSKRRLYDSIFIGNYYNPFFEAVGKLYAKSSYHLYYLDDGAQALSIFSDKQRPRYKSSKVKFILKCYEYGLFWKKCEGTHFFTIYNVESDKLDIIHNSLSFLKAQSCDSLKGVYIIGTNSSILDFRDRSYIEYLDNLLDNINMRWPSETITYCPHRRDSNNDVYKEWCESRGVNYFEPVVSVEFDFTRNGINPVSIIGFTSNALYTLKAIYPLSDVETVDYHLKNRESDVETALIRQRMSESSIRILNLFEEK